MAEYATGVPNIIRHEKGEREMLRVKPPACPVILLRLNALYLR